MAKIKENSVKNSDFRAILSWYTQMGVDTTISETPTNWLQTGTSLDQSWLTFKEQKSTSSSTRTPLITSPRPQPPAVQTTPPSPTYTPPAMEDARAAAKACNTLADLKTALSQFEGCGLKRTAKNLVFYRGSETAPLMIIGEAPGREEDIVGKPFVGRAGQLLDRMLKAIDRGEENTHITNIVYWRPPGNRTPTAEEAALCRPFLDRQIELVKPKLILFLGGAAAKQMYETPTGITKLRGKWKKIPGDKHTMDTLATLHPAYLLRTPIAKRLAWQDLQMIKEKLEPSNGC